MATSLTCSSPSSPSSAPDSSKAKEAASISSVSPEDYAQRFAAFMETEVLRVE